MSFYLEPLDKGKLPKYKPGIYKKKQNGICCLLFIGQFISVKHFVPELGFEQPRQYSLSSAPNSKYPCYNLRSTLINGFFSV